MFFYIEHVDSSELPVESFFSPIASPRISDDPEFLGVFGAPAHNGDYVVGAGVGGGVVVHTSRVVVPKEVGRVYVAGNRPSVVDFLHHSLFSQHVPVLLHAVDLRVLLGPTPLVRVAVPALYLRRTSQPVVVPIRLVRRTRLVRYVVLVNPHVRVRRRTSMAAIRISVTGDQNLRSD